MMGQYKTTQAFGILDRGTDKNNSGDGIRYTILLDADANHDGVLSEDEKSNLKPMLVEEVVKLGGVQIPLSLCVDLNGSIAALQAQNDQLLYVDSGTIVDTAYTSFLNTEVVDLLKSRKLIEKYD